MKRSFLIIFCLLALALAACSRTEDTPETTIAETRIAETLPVVPTTEPAPVTLPTETETVPTIPEPVVTLTEEEKNMLLKLGMAERGNEDCTECIALVMCTVLNRVETEGRFSSSVRGVILAPEQFTPVMDGTYDTAEPNQRCYDALDMVIYGWDESQGALFYEWCEGESWHSKNLHLLFQHCDVRFYE